MKTDIIFQYGQNTFNLKAGCVKSFVDEHMHLIDSMVPDKVEDHTKIPVKNIKTSTILITFLAYKIL